MSAHDVLTTAIDIRGRIAHLRPPEQLAAIQAAFVATLCEHATTVERAEAALSGQIATMQAQVRVRFQAGRNGTPTLALT